MPRPAPLTCALALALAPGCAALPAVDAGRTARPASLPAPQIAPLDRLLAQGAVPPRAGPAAEAALAARAAALRLRAAAMRGPVADPATRARIAAVAG